MKSYRNLLGYLLGFALFVVFIPALMWLAAGDVSFTTARTAVFVVLAVVGLGLSIWSIVYMKRVGKGNPMDAFNHEVAPRTSVLMTEGPYSLCRNPMLLGVLLYYLGVVILLNSAKPALILAAYAVVMTFQVLAEERRLEQDFGAEYVQYKQRTKRLIPYVW